jgi:hypothetical protein
MLNYKDFEPKNMNVSSSGMDYYEEYKKYKQYCESKRKQPRSWNDWYYCTYSAFEESHRLNN